MENNKLIAEFMGAVGSPMYKPNEMKYHSSWDWLMPVIEKIEHLGYTFEKNYQPVDKDWQCLIVKGNDILHQDFANNSLDASYYVVSALINDYNNKLINK